MLPKYRNRKVTMHGEVYDSVKEARRHSDLKMLERAGKIIDLKRQVKFELIPTQRDSQTGKVLERSVSYIADFTYYENGRYIVEDVKGFRTPEYRIKKKLLLWLHGIRIKET